MVVFQTKMQQAFAKRPDELIFKRLVYHREMDTSRDILEVIRRLEMEEQGEELLVRKLEVFDQPNWTIIRNLRLKDFSTLR